MIQELKHEIKVTIDEIRDEIQWKMYWKIGLIEWGAASHESHLNEISCLMAMYYLSNKAINFEKYSCVFFAKLNSKF